MGRILIAWELGGNYGHLARLLPLAKRLRSDGHQVLLAIRDMRLGAELCSPHGLPYVQSPISHQIKPRHLLLPANYAEILLCEGFAEPLDLQGRVSGWLDLYRLWSPDVVVVDHAPTALFSTRLANLPALVISSGFEVPPDEVPNPCIRPWEAISKHRLAESEARVVNLLNIVTETHGGLPLATLSDLFRGTASVFITFPELDHYGARPGAHYIGPLSSQLGLKIAWPQISGRRIFVYMRARVPGAEQLLGALGKCDENVVCVMPDAPKALKATLSQPGMKIVDHTVDVTTLLPSTDLVVSYGGSGIVNMTLLAGVPLMLVPRNVEQYLVAKCVERLGAGWVVGEQRRAQDFIHVLDKLLGDAGYIQNARAFAQRHQTYSLSTTLDRLVSVLDSALST